MDDKKIKQIQKLLDVAEGNLSSARHLLLEITGNKKTGKADHSESARDLSILNEGKVIEGVFDGEQMIAPDGKKYPVPANYASKSKLVEGDVLKLTILEDGSLIYKQIHPVSRKNLIGTLSNNNGNYTVLAEGKNYKVLFASVTYYKGEPGNKAAIIIPDDKDSTWAAIESIIHEHNESQETKPTEGDTEKEPEKEVQTEKTEETTDVSSEKPETTEPQDVTEAVKKSKDNTPPPKKVDIPSENKEILEEINTKYSEGNNSLDDKTLIFGKGEGTKDEDKKAKTKYTPPKMDSLSEDMTVNEASQVASEEAAAKEQLEATTSEIKKEATYTPEPEATVKVEPDTNSLGEKPPAAEEAKDDEIKELEI